MSSYAPSLSVWAYSIKIRDKLTCQLCGQKFDIENLVSHHINQNTNTRLLLSNGITLCRVCHGFSHSRVDRKLYFLLSRIARKLNNNQPTTKYTPTDYFWDIIYNRQSEELMSLGEQPANLGDDERVQTKISKGSSSALTQDAVTLGLQPGTGDNSSKTGLETH